MDFTCGWTPMLAAIACSSEAAVASDEQPKCASLDEHAGGDQWFAAGVVGEPAGRELAEAPDERVGGGDDRDLLDGGAVGREVEGRVELTMCEGVVVFDAKESE